MNALSILLAQTAAPAAGTGGGSSLAPFLFQIGAIFAIFYFLMIRPQQKQRKAHEAAIMALKKGDHVVTAGGIVGEVIHIAQAMKDGAAAPGMGDHITIKCADTKLVVVRSKIASIGSEEAAG